MGPLRSSSPVLCTPSPQLPNTLLPWIQPQSIPSARPPERFFTNSGFRSCTQPSCQKKKPSKTQKATCLWGTCVCAMMYACVSQSHVCTQACMCAYMHPRVWGHVLCVQVHLCVCVCRLILGFGQTPSSTLRSLHLPLFKTQLI